jgi:hypothetical protein
MQIRSRFRREAVLLTALAVTLVTSTLEAAWSSFSLPNLPNFYGAYQAAHLPDGRLVYGSENGLAEQTTFGSSALSNFQFPQTWDPSDVAIFSNTVGVVSVGGFSGPSGIYKFDPSNLATPFTAIPGLALQNYSVAFRNSASLYVGGQNGTGGKHAISYVTLDGVTNKVIIDNVSNYSGDFAIDLSGNLYVTNNNDHSLYKFTAAQLSAAIGGSALSLANGLFVTTLNNDSSIAVDGLGRIWTAGYLTPGIDLYDPASGTTTTFVPALANTNYVVSTFSNGTDAYVGYINAAGTSAGSGLTYGYEKAANLVPEPSAALLLACSAVGLMARRRQRIG